MPHAHHQPEPQPALTVVMPSGGCNAPSVWVLKEMLRLEGWMSSHHRVLEIQKLSLKCEDLWSRSLCQYVQLLITLTQNNACRVLATCK